MESHNRRVRTDWEIRPTRRDIETVCCGLTVSILTIANSPVLLDFVVLSVAAFVAGAINSVAGGGTLITFPALVSVLGHDPLSQVIANATNTVALCPGSATGAWAYRRELGAARGWLQLLLAPSVLGGIAGAIALVYAPENVFALLVPWLILAATLLFLLQPSIARWTGIGRPQPSPSTMRIIATLAFQFLVALYGGYFGAGIGILTLSALALMGLSDIHQMNAVKTVLATSINGVAVVIFIVEDKVDWQLGLPMIATGMLGGYLGARVARSLNRNLVRRVVVAIGFSLAAYYFWKNWGVSI
jgi:uncharacterized membrane protein YfcA